MSGRGRRPGAPDTRAEILAAARSLFAERGFSSTSIRAIAGHAGVDPALVHHYFGTKAELFQASLSLVVNPLDALAPVVAGGIDGAGERLVRAFLGVWDDPQAREPLLALVHGITEPAGQRLMRDGLVDVVLAPLGPALDLDEAPRRLALVASQLVGIVVLRYLVRVEPLASMPGEQLVATYAPTLQRYLDGPLDGPLNGPLNGPLDGPPG